MSILTYMFLSVTAAGLLVSSLGIMLYTIASAIFRRKR